MSFTAALVAIGAAASVASSLFGAAQSMRNAKASKAASQQKAKADVRAGIAQQEQFARDERLRQSREHLNMLSSGFAPSYGSPFLLALDNAENAERNRINFGKGVGLRSQSILDQGQARSNQYRTQAIQGIGNAISAGISGYQGYSSAKANKMYLSGNSLPGVS